MLLNILLFIFIFLIIFFLCFFILVKKDLLIENLYLIIPAICIAIWALYALYKHPPYWDYYVVYSAGEKFLTNPTEIYDVPTYIYMPSCAVLIGLTVSIFPYSIGYYVLLIYNYIWGVLGLREFNKILIFMNLKEKLHRFMFLIVISNGYFVFTQFWFNQTKYLLMLILLFIIRRELQFNKNKIIKDLKYYLINYNLFILAIGVAPHFIFYLIIYIFQNIPRNELFHKENIKKYCLVFLIGVAQNFLFILYPSLLLDFIEGYGYVNKKRQKIKVLYLREWFNVSFSTSRFIGNLTMIIFSIIVLFLILSNKLRIQEKFGYFSIAYVLIGFHFIQSVVGLVLFTLVILLFIPYLNQDVKGLEFIKANRILLIGLLSIAGMFFIPGAFIITEIIPEPEEYPLVMFYNLRWIFLLAIMLTSLFSLHLNRQKEHDGTHNHNPNYRDY